MFSKIDFFIRGPLRTVQPNGRGVHDLALSSESKADYALHILLNTGGLIHFTGIISDPLRWST